MGDKIKSSKDEIKATANAEIQKMVLRKFIYSIVQRICKGILEIDELKKNEAKLFEDVERAKNEKRSAETTLEEILKSRRNEDRNGEINQLQMRQVFKMMLDRSLAPSFDSMSRAPFRHTENYSKNKSRKKTQR